LSPEECSLDHTATVINAMLLNLTQIVVLAVAWLFAWRAGKRQVGSSAKGWWCILGGLGLLFLGSVLDLVGSVGRPALVENTPALQGAMATSAGCLLLSIGLVRWTATAASDRRLNRQDRDLGQRVKELDCLYRISSLLEEGDVSVEEMIRETLKLIPSAYQYPKITCVRVLLNGIPYCADNFRETYWKQSATIFVADELGGAIEVCYLEEMPAAAEGPFLLEERRLLNSIAERLGKIVAHKRAEARVASLTREMEFVLRATGTWLDVIDEDFNVHYVDPARRDRYGDPTRKKCYEYLHDRSAVCDVCGAGEALLRNGPIVRERTICEGGDRVFQVTSIPFQGEDGKRLVAQVHADVTQRKRNEELEQSKQVAELANLAKSEFLANMSHEIRTPMTAILGFAEVLRTEGDLSKAPPARIEAIDTVIRNGNHLLELISDILDLSKIESGKLTIERIPCSPCKIISEVASLMRVRAKAKALALEVDYAGTMPELIRTDPTRLRQVLINLIGNAVKFTETGGIRLLVRFVAGNGVPPVVQFEVVDTGIGLTDEQMAVIFDPFTQADVSTTRMFGGTGLGLTISMRLAKILGGDITVTSSPGRGSTFTLTVETGPLEGVELMDGPGQALVESEAAVEAPIAAGEAVENYALPACRVLLAEDGKDNQRLISFLLQKAGAEVVLAENGQIALDAVREARDQGNPFDVVLMDIQMPVMDGHEATRALRSEGYARPIVALTAHAMATDRQKCLDAGCDDYMTKPVDRKKLIAIVAKYVRRERVATSD